MSSITVIIDQRLSGAITLEAKERCLLSIVQESAKLLSKKESEIVIKIEKYQKDEAINMPAVLIRAETSISRRKLIKKWGELLLEITKNTLSEHKSIHIAVKTYVIDSEWTEATT